MVRASDFRQKEVINVSDGKRLGFVYDVEIDMSKGVIEAIVVPGPGKVLGLFGRDTDYVIPWTNIKKVGEDIILVDMNEAVMKRYVE
ncbi:YlmC/YmxH family sporulation protein [Petroclostridium sp. X23]|jgi:YlmC/YmxH family sporulation protein|uniref:YlmC/YmxH family sporulation protein n=1 Tax=Petroclostridium sp. X23 TaxID=3045146 RepID=UPI0024ACD0FA|nr:YlmC/YmxH family sporulation protein [Petroclostridium sp. X23]WHH58900.1 YlmC/YmxH family sporulation protein [Petroclostridium sp. X23]